MTRPDDRGAGEQGCLDFAVAPIAPPPVVVAGSAVLSLCGRYRYELWRRWAEGPYALLLMLNPSKADATINDPTISKNVRYVRGWGYAALCVANLFAWRATDPRDMKRAADPIGPDNDATIRRLVKDAAIVIAAWGAHGSHLGRDKAMLEMLPDVQWQCLHRTKDGAPGHPLYLRGDAKPFPLLSA